MSWPPSEEEVSAGPDSVVLAEPVVPVAPDVLSALPNPLEEVGSALMLDDELEPPSLDSACVVDCDAPEAPDPNPLSPASLPVHAAAVPAIQRQPIPVLSLFTSH